MVPASIPLFLVYGRSTAAPVLSCVAAALRRRPSFRTQPKLGEKSLCAFSEIPL